MTITTGKLSVVYDLRDDFTGGVVEHFYTKDQAEAAHREWVKAGPGQDMTVHVHEEGIPDTDYVNLPPELR
jgi:hypothetical protein